MTLLSRKRLRPFAGPALVALAALAASLSLILRGASCGHDFDFHLVSWIDALHSWRQGILYPRWAPSPNYGAGEPRFIFYPPITWMAGALLRALMPWKAVPAALTFLIFLAAGLSTRALARQLLPIAAATFAGCVAIFSGYSLFTAYERSDFGELTGSFWVPLLLLFLLREPDSQRQGWRCAFDGSGSLLALIVAGAWLSNAPLGLIASYTLAAVALVAALLRRSWVPLQRATLAAVLGLGLAAIYLVPADLEQPWVAIHQATNDPGYLIENNWFFARHAGADMRDHDVELFKVSVIGAGMLFVTLLGAAIQLWRTGPDERRRWWLVLAFIPFAVLFLQLPISHPVWNLLPRLRYLQFPWRWLVALDAPMAVFVAGAVWQFSRRWRTVTLASFGAAAALLSTALVFGLVFYNVCDEDDSVRAVVATYYVGDGFLGADEYAPPGVDNSIAPLGLPMACLSSSPTTVLGEGAGGVPPSWDTDQHSCDATFDADQPTRLASQHLRIHGVTPHPGYLILRLRRYPAWQVRVNGILQHDLPLREDGLIVLPVPQGPVSLAIDWTDTQDILIGRAISVIALLLFAGLWLIEHRQSAPQVS